MKARQLFEFACPAPVAPPKERPGTAPARERPGAPVRPSKRPNPFRRKDIKPGEEPKPKASLGGYAYEERKTDASPEAPSEHQLEGKPVSARALIEGTVDIDVAGASEPVTDYRPTLRRATRRDADLLAALRLRIISKLEREGVPTPDAEAQWNQQLPGYLRQLQDPQVRKRYGLDDE